MGLSSPNIFLTGIKVHLITILLNEMKFGSENINESEPQPQVEDHRSICISINRLAVQLQQCSLLLF